VTDGNPAVPVNLTDGANPFREGVIGLADTLRSQSSTEEFADYFDLGEGYANFDGQVTLSMWLWRTHVSGTNNSWYHFISLGDGPDQNNIWMGREGTAAHTFIFEVTPPGQVRVRANGALAANENEWIHLAATNDNGASALYVNGALASTGTTNTPTFAHRAQNYVGRWPDGGLCPCHALFC
jgi:hypothetical protein